MDLVKNDVSEEWVSSIFWVEGISEIGTGIPLTSNYSTLGRNTNYRGEESIGGDI
jgi:hypothetical protein